MWGEGVATKPQIYLQQQLYKYTKGKPKKERERQDTRRQ